MATETPITTSLQVEAYADLGATTDILRTTPSTNGQNVKGWTDQSGVAHHFTEVTNCPTLETNAINGKAAILFDGTNDILTAAAALFDKQATTLFLVLKPLRRSEGVNLDVVVDVSGMFVQIPASYSIYNFTSTQQAAICAPSEQFHVACFRWGSANAGIEMDGRSVQTLTKCAAAGALTTLKLGGYSGGGFPFKGYIAAVLAYGQDMSDADRVTVRTFLNTRYALPPANPVNVPLVVVEGDSRAYGFLATLNSNQWDAKAILGTGKTITLRNAASSAATFATCTARAAEIDTYYSASRRHNILLVECGINAPGTAYNEAKTYCASRVSTGFQVGLECLQAVTGSQVTTDAINLNFENDFTTATATAGINAPAGGITYARRLIMKTNGPATMVYPVDGALTSGLHQTNAGQLAESVFWTGVINQIIAERDVTITYTMTFLVGGGTTKTALPSDVLTISLATNLPLVLGDAVTITDNGAGGNLFDQHDTNHTGSETFTIGEDDEFPLLFDYTLPANASGTITISMTNGQGATNSGNLTITVLAVGGGEQKSPLRLDSLSHLPQLSHI